MKRKAEEEEKKKEVEEPVEKKAKEVVEEEKKEAVPPKFKKPKVAEELINGCKVQIEKIAAKNNGNKPEEPALHDMVLSLFEKAYKKATK